MKKNNTIFILLLFILALSACSPPPATLTPIETVFAATHNALVAQTEAAKEHETATPIATNTRQATPTPFPSATIVVLTPTFTPTVTPDVTATNVSSGSGDVIYACEFVKLSHDSDYIAKPNEKIRWVWNVKNVGTKKWFPDTMAAVYSNGSEYHVKPKYPLGDPTDVGETGVISIQMVAPKEPGIYPTTWVLKKGTHYFCYAQLKIIVRK